MTPLRRALDWALPASRNERIVALWAFAYFFVLLLGNAILRPLRDQMGIAGGTRHLPWLFLATFLSLLVVQPLYGALVKRMARTRFIAVVYQFFVFNMALFWLLLTIDYERVIVARVFFVWVSVFNVFGVAVFWSLMADLFNSAQGKRVFGFIGAGGSLGALLGPALTIALVQAISATNLLIIVIVCMQLVVVSVYFLERAAVGRVTPREASGAVGGSIFSGLTRVFTSPYLAGIAAWVSLLSFGGTILYLEQQNLVAGLIKGANEQTKLFAEIDLIVNLLAVTTQLIATTQVLRRFGTGISAAALPFVYVIGFGVLAAAPSLMVVFVFQVVQRWMNFAIASPARQIFYTVVGRDEKYKAKNVIDNVVFRGSDFVYGQLFGGLTALGLKISGIALCSLPVALGWLYLSTRLGRSQERRAAVEAEIILEEGTP